VPGVGDGDVPRLRGTGRTRLSDVIARIALISDIHANLPAAGNYDSTVATDYEHCGCRSESPRQEELAHVSYEYTRSTVTAETKHVLGALPLSLDVRPLGGHAAGPRLVIVRCTRARRVVPRRDTRTRRVRRGLLPTSHRIVPYVTEAASTSRTAALDERNNRAARASMLWTTAVPNEETDERFDADAGAARMRTSGEAEAIDDEGDATDDATHAIEDAGRGTRAATPPRPYPIWTKVEVGKRRLPPMPPTVSRPLWARLSRQIASAMRQRIGSAMTLRSVVRAVNAEMLLAGATPAEVEAAMRTAVAEHPELSTLDRMNVLTRQLASDAVLERILAWLGEEEARASDGDAISGDDSTA
jgi:hypothetical protein